MCLLYIVPANYCIGSQGPQRAVAPEEEEEVKKKKKKKNSKYLHFLDEQNIHVVQFYISHSQNCFYLSKPSSVRISHKGNTERILRQTQVVVKCVVQTCLRRCSQISAH